MTRNPRTWPRRPMTPKQERWVLKVAYTMKCSDIAIAVDRSESYVHYFITERLGRKPHVNPHAAHRVKVANRAECDGESPVCQPCGSQLVFETDWNGVLYEWCPRCGNPRTCNPRRAA